MSHKKMAQLLNKLYSKTSNGELDWTVGDDGRSVKLKIADRMISLEDAGNDNDEPLELLTIFGRNGEVVERIDDEYFSGQDLLDISGHSSYWSLMASLREMAFRYATGADEALDEILNELDKGDIPF